MNALVFLLVFAASAASDTLAIAWHDARERGGVLLGTMLAMALEALSWAPAIVAIEISDSRYLVAAVLGAGVANARGLRRYRRRKDCAKLPLARIVP